MYRSENQQFLNAALSDDARIKRGRTRTVNLQMTFISWSLEFISGIITMAFIYIIHHGIYDNISKHVLLALDICINSIVIPGSYLLNSEVNKSLIVAGGWYRAIRNLLLPARHNQIQPEPPIELNVIPRPIASISGNIDALEQRRRCDETYVNITETLSERTAKETIQNTEAAQLDDTESV